MKLVFSTLTVFLALVANPALASPSVLVARAAAACHDTKRATTLYRLYNPQTQDHIYTMNSHEVSTATTQDGYIAGDPSGSIFATQAPGTTPLFRLHNVKQSDHLYTASAFVKKYAIKAGYHDEGITGYIFSDGHCAGTVPLYGLWNKEQTDHLYTQYPDERDPAKAAGYLDDGIAGYVVWSL